jgi:TPR repeat protein
VVDNNRTKPPAQKGTGAADSSQADSSKAPEAAKKADDDDSTDADESASAPTSDSKTANTESGKKAADESKNKAADAASSDSTNTESEKKAKGKAADEESESASKASDETTASTKQAKSVRAEEPAKPKSLGDKDPLIIQADKYIQGRGVRQNCSTGVNLLRQAVGAGNPEASVKFGALYWSGTCVTQSKVTAYQWFSRAHSLEPTNRWIERSRSSLWAGLSPQEKQRVGY